MADSRKVYKGVYVIKLIMAYVVVAIHTTDWSLMGLTETAVPYFFIASGFFLFRKLGGSREEDLTVIKQWILKILKLYLIWTAIYLPFTIVGYFKRGLSITTYILAFFRNLVFFGENYLSWPLWYLLALVWDGIMLYLMRWLRMPVWSMFLIGLALFTCEEFFDIHQIPFYTKFFLTTRNGLFLGLVFVTAGGLIYQNNRKVITRKGLPVYFTLSALAFCGYQYNHLSLLPLAIGLFLISLNINVNVLTDRLACNIGSISKTIYLAHMAFAGLLLLFFNAKMGAGYFFITSSLVTLFALSLQLIKKQDLSWIR